MKKLAILLMCFCLGLTGYAQSVSLPGSSISPAPLDTVENGGTGEAQFIFVESSGGEIVQNNPATEEPNVTIQVIFSRVELTNGDISGIEGSLLNFFDPSYDAGTNILTLTQNSLIPGDSFGFITMPITVIENSSQQDALNGFTANISATDPNTNAEGNTSTFTFTPINELSVIKSQTSPAGELGTLINYDIEVTNTGNTTLFDIEVSDPTAVVVGGPISVLNPGDSATVTATHEINQDDINLGYYENSATATTQGPSPNGLVDVSDISDTGTDPNGVEIINPEGVETPDGEGATNGDLTDDPTVATIPRDDTLAVIKTSVFNDENGDGLAQVNETITYNFLVTNTGNSELTDIVIDDPLVTVTGGPINLGPGESDGNTFSAVYMITQEDVDAGGVTNQATVTGQNPDGGNVTDLSDDNSNLEDDPTLTDFPEDAGSIALIKTSIFNDENGDGYGQIGETIVYSFTVTNTGNVTVSNIIITDPLVTVEGGPIELAPGEVDSITFTAIYTITQEDADSGEVSNQATAIGQNPEGGNVTDLSDNDSNLEDEATITNLPIAPDYSPTVFAGNTNVIGDSDSIDFRVFIGEFEGQDSNGVIPVELRIVKNDNLEITYDPNLTTINGSNVSNADWQFDDTNPALYRFIYVGNGGIFVGNTASNIGINAVYTAAVNTTGTFPLKVTIRTNSGGEINNSNNDDLEYIEYKNN